MDSEQLLDMLEGISRQKRYGAGLDPGRPSVCEYSDNPKVVISQVLLRRSFKKYVYPVNILQFSSDRVMWHLS